MKLFVFVYVLLIHLSLNAQNNRLEKGIVIDTVWIDKNPGESFSLYLPNQYEPEKPSPAIFIFEPMARGKIGIQPFISAAEQYGYILICSNNSKNGPYKLNFAVANNLFSKAFSTFEIDQKRIYTAGFSGGGRLASTLAIQSDKIQGVVSCGAGFNLKSRALPSTQKFSYVSIMGDEDMNYHELQFTENYLKKTQTSFEFFTFDINHRWPDQDQILLAYDWLQLEAYKNQLIEKDSVALQRIYAKFYKRAIAQQKNNQLITASESYQRILKNFGRHYYLDSIQKKYKSLRESRQFKSQHKKNQDLLSLEEALTDEIWLQFDKDLEKKNYSLNWWENRINKLKKKEVSDNLQESKMYKRLLYKIFAHAIETARYDNTLTTIQQRMLCYDICILVYPTYALPYYRQIQYLIAIGEKDKSLDYLEKLLASGIDIKEVNLHDNVLESLKDNDRFKDLMKE